VGKKWVCANDNNKLVGGGVQLEKERGFFIGGERTVREQAGKAARGKNSESWWEKKEEKKTTKGRGRKYDRSQRIE